MASLPSPARACPRSGATGPQASGWCRRSRSWRHGPCRRRPAPRRTCRRGWVSS